MRRNITMTRFASLSLASLMLVADAQEAPRNSIRGSSFSDLPICQPTASTSCERAATTVTRSEKEFTFSVERPALRPQCKADLVTEYLQWNTLANVKGTIEVEGCAAAAGEYTIVARVAGANGTVETLEFRETWQRDDDRNVTFDAEYPLGENVELLNLRARDVRCDCADPEAP